MECAPAFNYGRSPHKTEIIIDSSIPSPNPCEYASPSANTHMKALFTSPEASLDLDLRYVPDSSLENVPEPDIKLEILDLQSKGHLGLSVCCQFELVEGQAVTFILRTPPKHAYPDAVKPSKEKADQLGVPFESMRPGSAIFYSTDLFSTQNLFPPPQTCVHPMTPC